jgi:hypothetical protein
MTWNRFGRICSNRVTPTKRWTTFRLKWIKWFLKYSSMASNRCSPNFERRYEKVDLRSYQIKCELIPFTVLSAAEMGGKQQKQFVRARTESIQQTSRTDRRDVQANGRLQRRITERCFGREDSRHHQRTRTIGSVAQGSARNEQYAKFRESNVSRRVERHDQRLLPNVNHVHSSFSDIFPFLFLIFNLFPHTR